MGLPRIIGQPSELLGKVQLLGKAAVVRLAMWHARPGSDMEGIRAEAAGP
jgi:hypothetical protein